MGPGVAVWSSNHPLLLLLPPLLLLLLLLRQRMCCLCVSVVPLGAIASTALSGGSLCPRPPWCWDSELNCTARPGACDSPLPAWRAPASPRDLLVSSSFHEGRLLLNISWAVSPDASTLVLQGWRVELVFTDLHRECTLLLLRHPVPTPRHPRGHKWRVQACACVSPGEAVLVNVYSLPGGSEAASVFYTAPGCHEEEVARGATWSCHGETELQVGVLPVGDQGLNVSFARGPRPMGVVAPRRGRWVVRACQRSATGGACSWELEQLSVEEGEEGEEGGAVLTQVPRLPCVCVQVFLLAHAQERVQVCPFMDTALQLRVWLSGPEGGALHARVAVEPGGCALLVLASLYARGTQEEGNARTALADTLELSVECHPVCQSFPVTFELTQPMIDALHHGAVCVQVWSTSEYRVLSHTDCISTPAGSLQFLLLLFLLLPLVGAVLLAVRFARGTRHRETSYAREGGLPMTESPLLRSSTATPSPPSSLPLSPSPPLSSPPPLPWPPLLIVHSHDQAILHQAVLQLAWLLRARCGHALRVVLDAWESVRLAQLGPARWVATSLTSVVSSTTPSSSTSSPSSPSTAFPFALSIASSSPLSPSVSSSSSASSPWWWSWRRRRRSEEEMRATVLVICSPGTRGRGAGAEPRGDVMDATLELLLGAPHYGGGPRVLVAFLRGAGGPWDVPPALRSQPCFSLPRDLDALCARLLRGAPRGQGLGTQRGGTWDPREDLEASRALEALEATLSELDDARQRVDLLGADEEREGVWGGPAPPRSLASSVTNAGQGDVTTDI
ncbi:uncharacterized protein LOC133342711 isoform X1 [Lethenteron reissneri]|uniref:uncharacterized protein LOC133342711 isoform X1 n=1 Tax=Lethenteron reissneri TaxID=7753 RepID=UPI002AB7367D|nr:uncharacterized protein LOC133342711 isoform X1 [Lethenteron reissneri]